MKQWTKDIVIDAPIEQVWQFLDGSLENMQKIMPQVVDHKAIKVTEEGVGSVYRQKYKEGKRIEEYDVKTLEFVNSSDLKKLKVGFTLANMFEITAYYELEKRENQQTNFKYTVTNQPLKWFVKLFLWFATDKVVVEFLQRVKRVAESDK
ncbi:hypothetical protein BTR23_09160 [Alkalihalophilus pseudofirmus]|nr:hypothetical protein BTR23_09160 [Alkalihalophilus pseudofirmus]